MEHVPINFTLTAIALRAIRQHTAEVNSIKKDGDYVPIIMWQEDYGKKLQQRLGDAGIHLGWRKRSELPLEQVQSIDGIELVFDVTPKQAIKFQNRIVDYINDDRFAFAESGTP